jgi:hypothetical protein
MLIVELLEGMTQLTCANRHACKPDLVKRETIKTRSLKWTLPETSSISTPILLLRMDKESHANVIMMTSTIYSAKI